MRLHCIQETSTKLHSLLSHVLLTITMCVNRTVVTASKFLKRALLTTFQGFHRHLQVRKTHARIIFSHGLKLFASFLQILGSQTSMYTFRRSSREDEMLVVCGAGRCVNPDDKIVAVCDLYLSVLVFVDGGKGNMAYCRTMYWVGVGPFGIC